MRIGLILITLGVAAVSAAQTQTSIRFTAVVHARETYTHPIGHGLFFSLKQDDGASWNFQVKPSRNSSENYTDCLGSPVLHGPATTDLLAWRFAPGAERGWAERVPLRTGFSFVTTAADQKYACANQQAFYDSFQRSQTNGTEEDYSGLPPYRPRPLGQGRVVIQAVMLKHGSDSKNAEFDQVTLYVSVRFPHRRKLRGR